VKQGLFLASSKNQKKPAEELVPAGFAESPLSFILQKGMGHFRGGKATFEVIS